MSSLEQLSQMVKEHLGLNSSNKWIISESPLAGRGLFATEDISTGELIFADHPLIYGPRAGVNLPRGCTVCYKLDCDNFYKCSKCALLLCSNQCENSSTHQNDCDIISRWSNKVPIEEVDDMVMSRALTPIRALLLNEDERQFMSSLAAHNLPKHGSEIRMVEQYFDIPEDEKQLLILACCVLDTNAYQMATSYGKNEMSLRGLYPVSSLMNSICVPNTRYVYNSECQMIVKAAKPIHAGTEICTCYSGLLWGTPARQVHLSKTKHFLCKCDRCADPTERGTLLAALKCLKPECPGSMLPMQPLIYTSPWQCLECSIRVPSNNVFAVQHALGSMLAKLDFKCVGDLEYFLFHRMTKFIPKTNQIFVDLQSRLIFGNEEDNWRGKQILSFYGFVPKGPYITELRHRLSVRPSVLPLKVCIFSTGIGSW